SESSIGQVLADAAQVELALVGMGSAGVHSSPHIVSLMKLTESEHAAFDKQHPVGDVCGRFVDAHGVPLGAPTDQRVLAVTFSQLLRIPEVDGVAAGAERAPGVMGLLRSGAIHTAAFDVERAREILARSGSAGDSSTDPARNRSARSSPARTGRTRSGPTRTGSRRCVAQALPDSRSTK